MVLARVLIYLPSTIYRTLELSYGIFGRYMVTERFVGGSSGPRFCTHWLMVTCSCDGCAMMVAAMVLWNLVHPALFMKRRVDTE